MAIEAQIFTILIVLHALRYAIYAIRYCTLYAIRNTKDYVRNFTLFLQNKAKLPNTQMNITLVYIRNYINLGLSKRGKNKAKTKPNEAKLKKAKMDLTLYLIRCYEKKGRFRNNESKPKAKPNKPNLKKAETSLNLYLTNAYEKNHNFGIMKTKPKRVIQICAFRALSLN